MDIFAEEYDKLMDAIRRYNLMDDIYMTEFFKDNIPAVQLVLRIILDNDDITVEQVETQTTIPNLHGRGVRLDVFAKDSTGKRYNIEVQCEDSGASVKRARYNSSLMDAEVTNPGESYEELPDVYVIFITQHDVLGKGLPIYHLDRMIKETGDEVNDGSHIIYVTADFVSETPLGKLMEDFNNPNPGTMNYEVLKEKAKCLKETKKGAETIVGKVSAELFEYALEKGLNQGIAKGRAEGKAEGKAEGIAQGRAEGYFNVALEMIKEKTPISMIQKFTKLSLEQLQKLSQECGVALVM